LLMPAGLPNPLRGLVAFAFAEGCCVSVVIDVQWRLRQKPLGGHEMDKGSFYDARR